MRKAQVIGAATGALLTVGITAIGMTSAPHEPFTPIDVAYMFMVLPIIHIYKIFGSTFWLSTEHGSGQALDVIPCCLMLITNSFLFFLVGTVIGSFVKTHKRMRGNCAATPDEAKGP